MYGAFYGFLVENPGRPADYDNLDPQNVRFLMDKAVNRDNSITPDEKEVRDETQRVCILGERYWLRAHP